MKKLLWLILLCAFCFTACSALPAQLDARDEAVIRLVTLSRQDELRLEGLTAALQIGDNQRPSERVSGTGENYDAAKKDLSGRRRASFAHATEWVVEENAVADLAEAFLYDPELTYCARIYLLPEGTTADEFLDGFSEENGPARSLEELARAGTGKTGTAMERLSQLAESQETQFPVLEDWEGQVEVKRWKTVKKSE